MTGPVIRGRLVSEPRPRKPEPKPKGSPRAGTAERLARRLALAHWIERKIEAGELEDYAHAAEVLGVTRARVSQVAGLALVPAGEQERILVHGPATPRRDDAPGLGLALTGPRAAYDLRP